MLMFDRYSFILFIHSKSTKIQSRNIKEVSHKDCSRQEINKIFEDGKQLKIITD